MSESKKSMTVRKTFPVVKVIVERGEANQKEFAFTEPFRIGREEPCDIRIEDSAVSRVHVEVYFVEGRWWVRDLNSANGTYVHGRKIDRLPLTKPLKLDLGLDGPILSVHVEETTEQHPTFVKKQSSVSQYVRQALATSIGGNVGKTTLVIRAAIKRIQKKQRKKYLAIISIVAFLLLITGGYSIYQHRELRNIKKSAVNIFYSMKSLELEVAQLKTQVEETGKSEVLLAGMNQEYEQLIEKLGLYRKDITQEERLILRVARIFGECEIELPELFTQEVKKYIKIWQSTTDFKDAINRARTNGYIDHIIKEMVDYGLPPHYFYVALQESAFDTRACGPSTRFGYAKGMWQFIPGTAKQYGLKVGRLSELAVADPEDERHNFEKSTNAAARYIRDIYSTEAQASGLLVMASYNWGETRVRRLIRQMPKNPQERNFWRLLELHVDKIPDQTYNYVFRIFSAAVIGEDPELFGFDFENPLSSLETASSDE